MKRILKQVLIVSASALALPVGAAMAQTAAAPTDSPAASGIDEIVVTAQRREEKAQNVPIAITSFSSSRIAQQNITQSQDLAGSVPSLIVGAAGQASRDVQAFNLRGQGNTFEASPGAVVYFNEVPLPASITLAQQGGPGNYIDLENIQVLAGPQGTLFGRNATGGAILLVPHKPTNDFSGSFQAKFGNYNDKELEGVLNIPIVSDKLLVRAVGGYHDRDGFTRDIVHNVDMDNVHWYSGRLGIMFRPTDDFENYFLAYGARSKNNGTAEINQGFNIAGLQGVGFCVDPPLAPPGPSGIAVSCNYYRNLTKQAQNLGPRATAPGNLGSVTTETFGFENTSRYDLTDEMTLRNVASYQQFKNNYYYDGDGTIVQQYDSSLSSNPLPRDYIEDIMEEFQLQGNFLDKRLTFTTGFVYYDQRPAGAQGVSSIVYCPAAFTGFCSPTEASINSASESEAVYAQATLDLGTLTPALDGIHLTGGYRYTWDTITGDAYSFSKNANGTYTCVSDSTIVANNPKVGCLFGATLDSAAPNWTVGLDDRLWDSVLVYGKISHGYKAGGFNSYAVYPSTRTFTPEYVTSYEVGAKSDFTLGTVPMRLNGDYYFLEYENIQKATGDFNPVSSASGAVIRPAQAEIQGVELEATIRPIQQLEIGGSFSYTDFKYTSYHFPAGGFLPDCSGGIPAAGSEADLKCLAGQYISPYIFSIHATFTQPLPNDLGDLSVFVNYSHQSQQHTEATVLPPNQPGEALASFGLLNLSIDWNDIAGSGVDLGFWSTNLTNELYRISNTDVFQIGSLLSRSTIYGEPAMYGARLRYHFGPSSAPESAPSAYVPPLAVAPAPAPRSYLVFFDFNKSDLTQQAVEIVDTAARNAAPAKVTQLTVTGHTDTVGSDAYNMRLSRRRAESVATRLEKDGIPASEIEIVARGKRDLLVPTKDGVKEPQNRRVQIVYSGGPTS